MALRTVSRTVNFLPIIQCRLFHVPTERREKTHTITTQTYSIQQDKLEKFRHDNPLPDIRRFSGAVVRFIDIDGGGEQQLDAGEHQLDGGEHQLDGGEHQLDVGEHQLENDCVDESSKLLLVGQVNRIKLATTYLNAYFNNEEIPSKRKFEAEDYSLIWHGYRRNFKGQFAPKKPRKKCIRYDRVTGNPCPMCQMKIEDEYEPHFTDIEILQHFICPHTWNILDTTVTGLCRVQHQKIVGAIEKARLYGLLPFTLPLPSDEPVKHEPCGVPTDRKIKVKMH